MLNGGDKTVGAYLNQIKLTYNLLGLFTADANAFVKAYEEKTAVSAESFPAEVVALADKRLQAKQAKDWATADALRAEISALGYEVKDGKDCYTLIKK